MPRISAIAAIGKEKKAICQGQHLLWRIEDDLKRLRDLTMSHTLVMGRKTYESIGHPLPGRATIILTRNDSYSPSIPEKYKNELVETASSSEEAVKKASEIERRRNKENPEIFIFGGGEIYREMLDKADKLYLTIVNSPQDEERGTDWFPEYENIFTKEIRREERETPDGLKYVWVDLERA